MSPAPRLRATLQRASRWLRRTLVDPPLPLVALEVRARSLAAVRLASDRGELSLGAAASIELAPGVLEVSLTRPNVIDAGAFGAALRALLERVGALSGGPLSLVLPDAAVRVALVPAAGVRGRGQEAHETVRFRLHKALPFDVRDARLAWDTDGEQVLVAVAPDEVVRGYEEALGGLGFQVGLVEPAGLALAAAESVRKTPGDALLVNWDEDCVSFLLLREGRPLLVRTLPGESAKTAVAAHATSTQRFYVDRLGGPGLRSVFVRAAARPGDEACAVLGDALGVAATLVAPWAALGIDEAGPAAQAVAGAAASVLRRAA